MLLTVLLATLASAPPPAFMNRTLGVEVTPEGTRRLSYPLLFVHGVGNDAHDWGVDFAFDRCLKPKAVVERLEAPIEHRTVELPFSPSGAGFQVVKIMADLPVSGTVTCADGRVFSWDQTFPDLTGGIYKFGPNEGPSFVMPHFLIDGGNVVADPDGPVLPKGQGVPRPINVAEFIENEWSQKRGLREWDWPGKPQNLLPAGVDNLVMSYDNGTIPAFLSGKGDSKQGFDLDLTFDKDHPAAGINHNGIYFFSSQKIRGCGLNDWQFRMADAHSYPLQGPGINVSGQSGSAGVYMYSPTLVARFTIDALCPETGEHVLTVIPTFEVASMGTLIPEWRQEPTTTFELNGADGIATYSYSNFQTTGGATIKGGSGTLNLREMVGGLLGDKVSRTLDGFVLPHWEQGDFGQSGQLHSRLREVLDDYYGAGNWQNNPNARIDIVAHSQGGLVAREMIRGVMSSEALNPHDPISKIGHVITLGTPHLGSAVVTNASLIQGGHDHPTAFGDIESFATLGQNKAQFEDDTYREFAKGKIPLKLSGTVKIGLHLATAASAPYLSAAVDALDNLPDLNFTIYTKGLVRGVRVEGNLAGFEVFSEDMDYGNETSRLDAIFKATHLAWSEESPFILRLRNANFPSRPDGSEISVTTVWSSGVGGILTELLANVPEYLTADYCVDAIAKQKLGFWERTALESVLGPLGDLCVGGMPEIMQKAGIADDWIRLFKKGSDFDKGWSTKGDFVVEASSQRGADIYGSHSWTDAPNLRNPDIKIEVRPLLKNESFTSRRFALDNVAHGTLDLPNWGNYDNTCRKVPGEHLMYLDVWDALQHPPLPGIVPPATVIDYGAKDWCSLEEKVEAGTPGTWDGVAMNATHSGDFDLHTDLGMQGSLLAARSLSVASLSGDRVSISQAATRGTVLDICLQGVCQPSIQLASTLADEVRLQRTGNAWLAGARTGSNWHEKTFNADLPIQVKSQRITANRGRWELTGQPVLWGSKGTQTDVATPLPSIHLEARDPQPQSNLARLELRLRNTSDLPVSGLDLSFWFYSDSSRTPILDRYWLAEAQATLTRVSDNWYRVRIQTSATIPGGSTYPSGGAIQLGIHDQNWSPWTLVGPSAGVSTDWAALAGALVQDHQGRVLSGSLPDFRRLAYGIGPSLQVQSLDDSRGETNLSRVKVLLSNSGNGRLGAYTAHYWMASPSGKRPVVDAYQVPTGCTVRLADQFQNFWTVDMSCNELIAGGNAEFQFGLHFSDWSDWDHAQELSSNAATEWTPNEGILVELSDGFIVHGGWTALRSAGTLPGNNSDQPVPPVADPNELEVLGQRVDYGNQSHVRLAVRNNGANETVGFRLRYGLAPDGPDPVLETPYLAGCQAQISTTTTPHSVEVDCANIRIASGAVFPDPAGMLFWFHWPDWSAFSSSAHGSALGADMRPTASVTLLPQVAP